VALPDRRVRSQVRLGQGHPAAPDHSARDEVLALPLPRAWRSRAWVRALEARVRPAAAPRSRTRPHPTTRQPDDARRLSQALARARAVPFAA